MSPAAALALLGLAAVAQAGATEFRSTAEPTVLYDAPSRNAQKRYIVGRDYPLEVLVSLKDWSKVRDGAGTVAWVEARVLSDKRMLIVSAPEAEVRQAPESASAVVFSAERGVLLEMLEPAAAGWVRVRHRDGQSGFVRVNQVWGT